jgi:prophage regulatory protein
MPPDMLDRLTLDPGTRTLGELLQEREWAVGEIRRLRTNVSRLSPKKESSRIEKAADRDSDLEGKRFDGTLIAQRLLRLKEVSAMVGLRRSSIYQYISEGRFPAPVKVGIRAVRWKLAEVLAWSHLSQGRDNGREGSAKCPEGESG